jgi:hypothetical protein
MPKTNAEYQAEWRKRRTVLLEEAGALRARVEELGAENLRLQGRLTRTDEHVRSLSRLYSEALSGKFDAYEYRATLEAMRDLGMQWQRERLTSGT